jgi:heme a synthase
LTPRRLARAAWWLLGYTVVVILWGAFVRATGAGAGCGSHWPLCNGEVVPRSPSVETLIELGHRLTSGLLGIFFAAYAVLAFRSFPRGHAVRKGAAWSLFFVFAEALIGAGLVRFEWVAANVSQQRVYVMAFHLVNTFLLLGAVALTGWFASGARRIDARTRGALVPTLALATSSLLLLGASGAVTALGDTLVLGAGIRPEDSSIVAGLVARRSYHPLLALLVFVALVATIRWLRPRLGVQARRNSHWLLALFLVQLVLGAINVLLKAPIWMQLLHLAASDALWVAFVLFAAESLSSAPVPTTGGE